MGQFAEIRDHMRTYASPRFWRNTYTIEIQVSDESLWPTLVDNAAETLELREMEFVVEEVFANGGQLPMQLTILEHFTTAQTDDDAIDMRDLVPATVPSGLPVAD